MQIFYQNRDISADVDIRRCIHRDVTGGSRDLLDVEFEYSGRWFGWKVEKNDLIRIEHGGYSTGNLYVNTILPEQGRYRILATGASAAARRQACASFEDRTLGEILATCAAQCGMQYGLYGIASSFSYPFLLRENEDSMAFLDRILSMEGGRLKCFGSKLRAIGISYAQGLTPTQTIDLLPSQAQARYIHRLDARCASITVQSPWASASAFDTAAGGGIHRVITTLPAMNATQAGRWARGLLLNHNRDAEIIEMSTEFNPGLTALARIDITSSADMDGQWLVDEVEHDFMLLKSSAILKRCISTIR